MGITSAPFNYPDMQFSGQFQQNQPAADTSGGEADNWVTLLTTRLSLEKRSGSLHNHAGRIEYEREYILVCRKQSAFVFNADTRWIINGDTYKVTNYERVDMKPHFIKMTVLKNG